MLEDLSGVNYISSIGIPLLINSAKTVAGRGGKLALLKPRPNVAEVLELTGIPLVIRSIPILSQPKQECRPPSVL